MLILLILEQYLLGKYQNTKKQKCILGWRYNAQIYSLADSAFTPFAQFPGAIFTEHLSGRICSEKPLLQSKL